MKKYDFDKIINRGEGSGYFSSKWTNLESKFSDYNVGKDTLGMWIADMDFQCPDEVVEAVTKRAELGMYGYISNECVENFKKAGKSWFKRRYNYETDTKWMLFHGGIVPIINSAIQEFTEPGDGVIIQQPVYYPFTEGVVNNNRKLELNELIEKDGRYTIDFDNLRELAEKETTKLIVLCSPHNPVGRVWTQEELTKICEICCENDVLIFSDEIHADFVYKKNGFFTTGRLSDKITNNLIITLSPSKTFNLAGLGASLAIIPNEEIRNRLDKRMRMNRYPTANTFGLIAGEAAYNYGDDYVDQLVEYIEGNFEFANDYINENMDGVKLIEPEGIYLAWIDFRATGLSNEEINSLILDDAKVAVDLGEWFGSGGNGFVRFNFACPRSIVKEALERIDRALKNR